MVKAAIYTRVSTTDKDQNPKIQEDILRPWVEELGYEPVLFQEAGISGATITRPVLDRLVVAARRRQVRAVAVTRLDRLGRSLVHLLIMLQEWDGRGVRLLVHDQAIDSHTPHGKLLFSMVGAFAEFERSLLAERVKEGMAHAKIHGTRSGSAIGRPPLDVDIVRVCDAIRMGGNRRGLITRVAKQFGCSPGWIHKWVIPILREEGVW